MRRQGGRNVNFILINYVANSLYSLIADGQYRNTSVGRDAWKTLFGSQVGLQSNCNKEGFNAYCVRSTSIAVRIGILGNNEDDCNSCDTRMGFGGAGRPNNFSTCGNAIEAVMGYIMVQ